MKKRLWIFIFLIFPIFAKATLTESQKEKVKGILVQYKPESLRAEQAKAIHESFREAGLRGVPETDEAVREAGFDPDQLRDLDPPPGRGDEKQQRERLPESPKQETSKDEDQPVNLIQHSGFVLRSPEVADGGQLPIEYTGFGVSSTLPLEWKGIPEGTKYFALIMHHIPPEGKTKWYWILYNIPAEITSLPKNVKDTGILGTNSVNGKTEYAPPHSKGGGPKTYIYTVYALSAPVLPGVKPSLVTRDVLLKAMKNLVLTSAELQVVYSRPESGLKPDSFPKTAWNPESK